MSDRRELLTLAAEIRTARDVAAEIGGFADELERLGRELGD